MFLDNGGLVAGFAIFKPEIILVTAKNIITNAKDFKRVGSSPFINLVFIKTLIAVVSEDAPDPFHWLRGRQSPETT